MLTPQERYNSFKLLDSVFSNNKEAQQAYDSVIPERETRGFSLFNPLPEMFRQDVYSYAEIFCEGGYSKYTMREFLQSTNRVGAADLLARTMSVYGNYPKDEVATEAIGYGMTLFEQVTGFDINVVSESELEKLLPTASFPRKARFLYHLLELWDQLLYVQVNDGRAIGYNISGDHDDPNAAKIRLLQYGLNLASKSNVVDTVIGSNIRQGGEYFRFTVSDAVAAFKALTNYDFNNDLRNGNT